MSMIEPSRALLETPVSATGSAMPAIGAQVGTGAFFGFSMGYFLKKTTKLIMLLVGFIATVAAYLELAGIVSVHWNGLVASVGTVFHWVTRGVGDGSVFGFARAMIGVVPLGGSFAACALLGFKYG